MASIDPQKENFEETKRGREVVLEDGAKDVASEGSRFWSLYQQCDIHTPSLEGSMSSGPTAHIFRMMKQVCNERALFVVIFLMESSLFLGHILAGAPSSSDLEGHTANRNRSKRFSS